jgi:acyl-CoA synthetase (AMP-forming)/AMP-acid ligase II/acyl carrier protein
MVSPIFQTFVHLLQDRSQTHLDQTAYFFLGDGEIVTGQLTYQQLHERAKTIATYLQERMSPGDRALLLYPQGLDFIEAFFGCLYAGVIAIPAYPPRRNQNRRRLEAILSDSQAQGILTTQDLVNDSLGEYSLPPETLFWATDRLNAPTRDWIMPSVTEDTLAFLQYTSGSTGVPKGVMVSHHNLLQNSQDLDLGWNHTSESIIVTWLPTFHDMGLIYGVLQPLYKGIPCYLMSPVSFLQKPWRWLAAISRYRGTHSGAPNFAYSLCVDKISPEQCSQLDLSCWIMALNGAEPVRLSTLERFTQYFAPSGFSPHTFCPGYGLAEATLKVTATRAQDPVKVIYVQTEALSQNQVELGSAQDPKSQPIVGCGWTEIDTEIRIVDPVSLQDCSSNTVGEIWVSGSTVSKGYWNNPEATQETFQAFLSSGDGPFLRTGDLGFMQEGHLFITGRLKDLLIIRGRNYYPQDLEETIAESHPAFRAASGAVFSVEVEGEERLVVVQEIERMALRDPQIEEWVNRIREVISEEYELQVYGILFLKPASIPKTSSGKIQRQICRSAFLRGDLDPVGEWISPEKLKDSDLPLETKPELTEEGIQNWLVTRLASFLGLDPDDVDLDTPFAQYGLDSSVAIEVIGELSEWLAISPDPSLFWEYPSITKISRYLAQQANSND